MAQTAAGALLTRDTNKRKYGADYYARIGALGGKLGRTGGFHVKPLSHEQAVANGRKGGQTKRVAHVSG